MSQPNHRKRGLRIIDPELRFLLVLTSLALFSRLLWVMWIHPPASANYSDMGAYLARAQRLANEGIEHGARELAWQAWGTHYLLAIPLKLGGKQWGLHWAGITWGFMGAAIVTFTYKLARLTSLPPILAGFLGAVALFWFPHLSLTGFFLSEIPFCCFQLWGSYRLCRHFVQPTNGWLTGIVLAIAFALRPQIAIFFVFIALYWLMHGRFKPTFGWKPAMAIALPLLLMLGFSMWRYHRHTGQWGGISENMAMNLTAGRCHNIVTQAFPDVQSMRHSEQVNSTRDGRRVGLPGFRILSNRPDSEFFSLRPALNSPTIRFVGYIGDARTHQKIRKHCYEATGWLEQIRYSIVNLSLSWFHARHWPEINETRRHPGLWATSNVYRFIYQVAIWFPSLIACFWPFSGVLPRSLLSICRFQLLTSMIISAIFFGDPRLRTPYDPFAIILATCFIYSLWHRFARNRLNDLFPFPTRRCQDNSVSHRSSNHTVKGPTRQR